MSQEIATAAKTHLIGPLAPGRHPRVGDRQIVGNKSCVIVKCWPRRRLGVKQLREAGFYKPAGWYAFVEVAEDSVAETTRGNE